MGGKSIKLQYVHAVCTQYYGKYIDLINIYLLRKKPVLI